MVLELKAVYASILIASVQYDHAVSQSRKAA
jgi:hypothetical protein